MHRLQSPQPIQGMTIMAVAGIGIVVDTATAMLFMCGREHDINVRGAFLHMAADALVSAGVVVAGALALVHGWEWIDPAVSLAIAAVIVVGSAGLLKQSVHLLFDGVPDAVDLHRVRDFLAAQPGVADVLDLHVWALSTTQVPLTAHLLVPEGGAGDAFLAAVSRELHSRFGIEHVTLQIVGSPVGLTCATAPSSRQALAAGAQLGETSERPSLPRATGVEHEHS